MRPMAAIERLLERVFERSTARIFGLRLQPVQVLRKVERAMEEGRRRSGSRAFVPNQLSVALHPSDLVGEPAALEALAAELADGALAFARRRGYGLVARTHVLVTRDSTVEPGEVQVTAAFDEDQAAAAAPDDAEALGRTRAFAVPERVPPRLLLRRRRGGKPGPDVVVDGTPLTIGRDRACAVALDDPAVSRRHAQLQSRQGSILLTDLESTNGTWVNGHRVRETALGEGDVVEIGTTSFDVEVLDPVEPR